VAERQVTFVDTNVLAYAHDRSETRKQAVAQARLEELWRERNGVLSTQVLQELYVVATRKLATSVLVLVVRRHSGAVSTLPTRVTYVSNIIISTVRGTAGESTRSTSLARRGNGSDRRTDACG